MLACRPGSWSSAASASARTISLSMPGRRSISTCRGASDGAPAVVARAGEADAGRRAEAAEHGLRRDRRPRARRGPATCGCSANASRIQPVRSSGREHVVRPCMTTTSSASTRPRARSMRCWCPRWNGANRPAATPRDSGLAMGGTMPDGTGGTRPVRHHARRERRRESSSSEGASTASRAARRLALAGADVTVLEAREAGGPFAASAGIVARAALRVRPGRALHRARAARARRSGASSSACSGRRCYDETGMLWFASRSRSYLLDSLQTSLAAGLPVRLLEPAEASAALPGVLGPTGVAAVLHDEAGGVLHARRATLGLARLARAAGVDAARGRLGALGRRRRRRARRRQQRARRPGARRHRRLDARRWCRPRRSARPSSSTSTSASRPRASRSGSTTLDVYGMTDDGGAGLKVGGHAIGADIDPDDPAAARGPRGRGAQARRGGAPAAAGPALARGRAAGARRRRVLLRADADRGAHHRPPRRAHGRVRRLLGARLQVRVGARPRPPAISCWAWSRRSTSRRSGTRAAQA